jgi:hypothetical protein
MLFGFIVVWAEVIHGQEVSHASIDKYDETRPIEFILKTCGAGSYRYLIFGPAPHDWIKIDDLKVACSLVFDPTPCVSPANRLSSHLTSPKSSIGIEARRLIEGYCDMYPPMQQNGKDIAVLMRRVQQKIAADDSFDESLKLAVLNELAEIVNKARLAHNERLLISLGSEADRSKPIADDELIVDWQQDSVTINDELSTIDEMIDIINQQNIHHVLIKIPTVKDVRLAQVRKLVKKISDQAAHVVNIETRLVQMVCSSKVAPCDLRVLSPAGQGDSNDEEE